MEYRFKCFLALRSDAGSPQFISESFDLLLEDGRNSTRGRRHTAENIAKSKMRKNEWLKGKNQLKKSREVFF